MSRKRLAEKKTKEIVPVKCRCNSEMQTLVDARGLVDR